MGFRNPLHGPTQHRQRGTRVIRDAAQSIPNNVLTAITWQTEEQDDERLWTVGAPTVFDFAAQGITRGLYVVVARIAFAANATGYRSVIIDDPVGGSTLAVERFFASPTTQTIFTTVAVLDLASVLDIAQARVRVAQTSGIALDVEALETDINECSFVCTRLAR